MLIMTGLDHNQAQLAIREQFALTKENMAQTLAAIKAYDFVRGCVILSTCNRTELYVSVPESVPFAPAKVLCQALEKDYSAYEPYFTEKSGDKVIDHLCRMASGLDSQILGDDQIITQTREALESAREQACTDSYIETAFNVAISAAKIIKTRVILKTVGADSVPGKAIEKLKADYPLQGRRALVIGNGKMGRLVAELLLREGMGVTVTLRQYKKGVIEVPEGADTVNYSDRYPVVGQSDVVVSATSSPHFTLYREEIDKLTRLPMVFMDLAVPRDVEPSVGDLPGTTLLTIDELSGEGRAVPEENRRMIEEIIGEHLEKYNRWLSYKDACASVNPAEEVKMA